METKKCKCCGEEQPIKNFKKGRWGYVSVCMSCDTKHRREKRNERMEAQKQAAEKLVQDKRRLQLCDFTPRELMQELARRGYEGNLTFTHVETIDITNF